MRILFTRFPLESAHGGAEVQTLSLMRGLRERGHDVSFFGSCPVLLEESAKYKIPSTRLEIGPPPVTKWHALSFIWRQYAMRRKLKAQSSKLKADAIVMLSLSEKLVLTPILINQEPRTKNQIYWLEHDRIGPWLTRNPWLPRLQKWSAHATTICVSELSKELYEKLGWAPENIVAIPNGIDLQRFNKQKTRIPKPNPQSLHIGCVARLTKDKGVDLLIEAVKQSHNVQLTIIGTGKESGNLSRMIHTEQLENRVILQESHPDLGGFYQAIDVLVLPARQHDPFGLVAAEAMALGTPVIVTDACGIAGYLGKSEGIVIPADSAEALKKAIEKMRDPILRTHLGDAAMRAARGKFSLQRMVDAYEKLLTKV